jgi:glycosyltransferase involved in cell wall biosynthesis
VGPYPPPLGGVSTHIKRLSSVLRGVGLRVAVLNHFGHRNGTSVTAALHRNPFLYWLRLRGTRASLVHYHHGGRLSLLVAAALARRHPGSIYVITIHGHDLTRYREIPGLSQLTRWALGRFDAVIAVSAEVAQSIGARGRRAPIVLPAYLPSEEHQEASLPERAREFVDRTGWCLVVSAYRVKMVDPRADVYGLDLAIQAFLRLAPQYPDLRLAIFLANRVRRGRPRRYLDALMAQIQTADMSDRVTLHVGSALAPAFRPNVVYLRPSRTDGDAVSIRESLDAGTPVIASDVVSRPPGARVVLGHDVGSWCAAIERVLKSVPTQRSAANRLEAVSADSHAAAMIDFYARWLPPEALEQHRKGPPLEARMPSESSVA